MTGDTLCSVGGGSSVVLERIISPEPVIEVAVERLKKLDSILAAAFLVGSLYLHNSKQ